MIDEKISDFCDRLEKVEAKIDKVMINEIPHLQNAIDKIGVDVGWLLWIFKIGGSGIILGVIGALLKGILL